MSYLYDKLRFMATLTNGSGVVESATMKQRFLNAYMKFGRIGKTCEHIGLNTRTFYHWKSNDEVFLSNFNLANALLIDNLEDEAYRRAVEGTTKNIYQGGMLVGTQQEYSDTLLLALLKSRAPHKYKDAKGGADPGGVNAEAKIVHVHSEVPLAGSEDEIIRQIEKTGENIPFEEQHDDTEEKLDSI